MNRLTTILLLSLTTAQITLAQDIIPIDTSHWEINAQSYVIENFRGKKSIYLQGGIITLKDTKFLNGTIEFDIFLKEEQAFPGVIFRSRDNNAEEFYFRPHLPGKPDGTQAAASINGVTPWQLLFGPTYSFPYEYKYDDWTHIKLVVNDKRAQVFLDYTETPNLSWNLFHTPKEGDVVIRGGGASGMHIANVNVDKNVYNLVNFNPIKREPIAGLIQQWEVSDMFESKLLEDPSQIGSVIEARKWGKTIQVEEGAAANISRVQLLRDGSPGETVFARITINSDKDQLKLFHFGYSDDVIAILNGKPLYKGTNKWHSRDYRYLGTIGLFDAIYLDLKKGNNTLLMAVKENFGGWLITGKFDNPNGLKIK